MIQDLYWIYAFNLIVNSFLAFLTMAFFIQILLSISGVKSPRFRALMLSLPFLKLSLDPFLYNFPNWALMSQNNPLNAEAETRVLSVSFAYITSVADLFPLSTAIRLSLDNGQTFSPADMLALLLPPLLLKGLILSMAVVSMGLLAIYFFRLIFELSFISKIKRKASPCKLVVNNQKLLGQLKATRLIVSSDITMACAFGIFRKWICFPTTMIDSLTHDEFEAVVAHEVNHLHWCDGIVRALCLFISNLFWWVPTRWWMARMEFAQEKACDANILKCKIDRLDLASALLKAMTIEKSIPEPLIISATFAKRNLVAQRLKFLVDPSFGKRGKLIWLQAIILGSIALALFCGRFWIF